MNLCILVLLNAYIAGIVRTVQQANQPEKKMRKPALKIAIPVFDEQGEVFRCFKVLSGDRIGKRLPDVRLAGHGGHIHGFYYENSPLEKCPREPGKE